MGYWKSKVLPKIKKVFEKDSAKKAAAAEACKSFEASKDEITKEFEEKKIELQPKVLEIYEASATEIKTLVKEPKEAVLKKNPTSAQKFLEELVKIEFPGSKLVSEASSKYGPAYVSGPIFFIFEKISSFIVVEEKAGEPSPPPAAEGGAEPSKAEEEAPSVKEKEIAVEEVKKEEVEAEAAEKTVAAAEPGPKGEEGVEAPKP